MKKLQGGNITIFEKVVSPLSCTNSYTTQDSSPNLQSLTSWHFRTCILIMSPTGCHLWCSSGHINVNLLFFNQYAFLLSYRIALVPGSSLFTIEPQEDIPGLLSLEFDMHAERHLFSHVHVNMTFLMKGTAGITDHFLPQMSPHCLVDTGVLWEYPWQGTDLSGGDCCWAMVGLSSHHVELPSGRPTAGCYKFVIRCLPSLSHMCC